MAGSNEQDGQLSARGKRRVVVSRLLMIWVLLVSVYFLWEADRYTGLYAFLAEWQYDHLGHHLPILTFALLLILFGSPAAWLLRSRRKIRGQGLTDGMGEEAAVLASSNFCRALFGFAGGLAGAALLTLFWTLTLPSFGPSERVIAVGGPESADPDNGSVTLRGQILYTRTSAYAQDLWVMSRGVRFAPIFEEGADQKRIRYFVELLPTDKRPTGEVAEVVDRRGVLMRNNLPGSIVRLYRYAGYTVEKPFHVLYASSATLRWPYYVTAAQLAVAALLTLLAALVQRRHVHFIKPGKVVGTSPVVGNSGAGAGAGA